MKTGLEVWAEKHNTTAEEIKILLTAEGNDPAQFLNGAYATEEAIPTGRDVALSMMLDRGRSGQVTIDAKIIKNIINVDVGSDTVRSDALPGMLGISVTETAAEITESAEVPDEITETVSEQKVSEDPKPDIKESSPAEKRKKTKYSMNKTIAEEIFKPEADIPSIRSVRMFLLSLPEYKAQDVAVMSDEEIQAVFNKNYICISTETGTLIMPKANCQLVKEILSRNDNYFVPDV